jgi:hypothetical protein
MHQIYIRTYGLRNLGVSVFELENGRFSFSPTKIFRPAGSNPCRRRQHIRRQPKPVNIAVFCRKMAVYPRAFALFLTYARRGRSYAGLYYDLRWP